MAQSHDELLAAAAEAHEALQRAKEARRLAFRDALRGPVKGRDIAKETGLSESQVGRIARAKP